MSLADEAKAAHAAVLAAEAEAADAERKALRTAATSAVRATLTRPDGTVLTMTEAGLSAVHTDLDSGLVVWTAGSVSLAAQRQDSEDPGWVVRLVEQVDGQWTTASDRLGSLADLGAALTG
jgi:hypothetical protein